MKPNRQNQLYHSEHRNNKKQDIVEKLRCTALKLQERASDLYLLRNSCSSNSLRTINLTDNNDFRISNLGVQKRKSYHTLKSTLDLLEGKVNLAKQQLQLPLTSMKKNKFSIQIDEKEQRDHPNNNRNSSDSSITQKRAQKKFSSYVTSVPKPRNAKVFSLNPYSPRRHSIYYVSESIRAINQKNSLALEHINSSIKMIKACETFQIPNMEDVEMRKVNLKKNQKYKNKKTLVLDLDETLIHCVQNIESEVDMKLQIKVDGVPIKIGINIRPYALTFLKKMASKFELIIFTASHHSYADTILNQLDPEGEIFEHRLYRHHCYILPNQLHVKDLRILNRNLSETILVDNAAYSYSFQLQNGIPILPFYEGADFELAALQAYLDDAQKVIDVRELNKKTFKLHHYNKFFNGQQLVQQLYMNNFH